MLKVNAGVAHKYFPVIHLPVPFSSQNKQLVDSNKFSDHDLRQSPIVGLDCIDTIH